MDEVRTQNVVSAVQPDPPPATTEGSQQGTVGGGSPGHPRDFARRRGAVLLEPISLAVCPFELEVHLPLV